jgi:hypothetical protein
MVREPLPRGVKKAIERLEAEPERPWRLINSRRLIAGLCSRCAQLDRKRFCAVGPSGRMSHMGQKAKYSLRADVFRFTPESGLKSDIAPCRFRADSVAIVFLHHRTQFFRTVGAAME